MGAVRRRQWHRRARGDEVGAGRAHSIASMRRGRGEGGEAYSRGWRKGAKVANGGIAARGGARGAVEY